MTLYSLFSSPTGLMIGRLDLLHGFHPTRQCAACRQNILDDASDVEEADASRQKGRDGYLVGRIQHDRCKSAQNQSLSCET